MSGRKIPNMKLTAIMVVAGSKYAKNGIGVIQMGKVSRGFCNILDLDPHPITLLTVILTMTGPPATPLEMCDGLREVSKGIIRGLSHDE